MDKLSTIVILLEIDNDFFSLLPWHRLQGIVASMSRIPTFPRHLRNLVKVLYIEAIQASASGNRFGGKFKSPFSGLSLSRSGDQRKYIDGTFKDSEDKGNENTVDIV